MMNLLENSENVLNIQFKINKDGYVEHPDGTTELLLEGKIGGIPVMMYVRVMLAASPDKANQLAKLLKKHGMPEEIISQTVGHPVGRDPGDLN